MLRLDSQSVHGDGKPMFHRMLVSVPCTVIFPTIFSGLTYAYFETVDQWVALTCHCDQGQSALSVGFAIHGLLFPATLGDLNYRESNMT